MLAHSPIDNFQFHFLGMIPIQAKISCHNIFFTTYFLFLLTLSTINMNLGSPVLYIQIINTPKTPGNDKCHLK